MIKNTYNKGHYMYSCNGFFFLIADSIYSASSGSLILNCCGKVLWDKKPKNINLIIGLSFLFYIFAVLFREKYITN